jgi:hypothetical protein
MLPDQEFYVLPSFLDLLWEVPTPVSPLFAQLLICTHSSKCHSSTYVTYFYPFNSSRLSYIFVIYQESESFVWLLANLRALRIIFIS